MATQHTSSALHAPALSAAYPMAKPGYGKRSAPEQQARTRHDFALLPTRERYVAGFVDHLPEGAAMSVKTLAKQLPLYGQQAISTALTALSVAGHLRRVRCPVVGAGDETRWVFRTFWSRTARDNEWWNTYLATEKAALTAAPVPEASALDTVPPPPWAPAEDPPPAPEGPDTEQPPEPAAVPQQRTPTRAPATVPATPHSAGTSPAYLALARLGRDDHRLALSADDCTVLEPLAAKWLARGVSVDYLTSALTAGLPAKVDSPVGLLRR
ncbi:MarR family transcriptional regulator, partial [Streptomyces sp. b84]|uniref:MarR family transcriptional regulator n=1 Tax=Streptomyces sp. b84 TaxID=1827631 RepID=UPI00211D8ECE